MTFTKETETPVLEFDTEGNLMITASVDSSKDDFDFLIGKHKVLHKKIKERLNNCGEWIEFEGEQKLIKLLSGLANVETHYMSTVDGKPIEGMALRLFDPATCLWSIYWADSVNGKLETPVVGSFKNKIGHFFAKEKFQEKDILIMFKWDVRDKDSPVWSQAFSQDNGITWEWNWFMYFSKMVLL